MHRPLPAAVYHIVQRPLPPAPFPLRQDRRRGRPTSRLTPLLVPPLTVEAAIVQSLDDGCIVSIITNHTTSVSINGTYETDTVLKAIKDGGQILSTGIAS